MTILKNAALILALAVSFAATSTVVIAEEAASSPAANTGEIISRIEKALVEVSKSDFSAAQIHLKAARTSSESIAGNSDAAKKAHATLMQGQIQAKKGDIQKATEELNKAIELYKAL